MKRFVIPLLFLLICAAALVGCKQKESEIQQISFSEDANYPAALEYFWSDDAYHYVFPSIMAWDCTVRYRDGHTENLVDALGAGRVSVADMDAFDLPYWREPIPAEITDIRFEGNPDADYTAELICVTEDSELWYFMGSEVKDYVVEYATGAVEPLLSALRDWRVRPGDLDAYGVPYYTEPIEK